MNNSRILIVTIICCLLLGISCKRENKPKEEQHYGPTYLGQYVSYFYFKPGSYWIYENNRTGEMDTCTLQSILRDTVTLFGETVDFKRWFTQERIDFNVFSTARTTIVRYQTTRPCMTCPNIDTSILFVMLRGTGQRVFFIPADKLGPSTYYTSYTIGSETFFNVYKFDCINDSSLPFWDQNKFNVLPTSSSYFWAENKGLVRIMYKGKDSQGNLDSAYWNLKAYKIEKF